MREVFTKRINNLFVFLDFAIYNCRRGGARTMTKERAAEECKKRINTQVSIYLEKR